MRKAFFRTLTELAEKDPRVMLLTADLGYLAVEPFSERFPDRFCNVGVAEQNMVGIATGLAEAGFIPFVYSIVSFAVLRPYEFIRNGPIHHRLPVRIVGVGGGFDYGHDGITHYGIEDVGILRLQPGITIVAPADYQQAVSSLLATWDLPGPVYYRLSKDDKTLVRGLEGRFELGRAATIGDGTDLLVIAMGDVASEAIRAVEVLGVRGISCTVMVVACFNPAPIDDLAESLAHFRLALTLEAHFAVGGIGSLVSEVIAERGLPCRLVRCGINTAVDGISGSRSYMLSRYGLSAEAVAAAALEAIGRMNE